MKKFVAFMEASVTKVKYVSVFLAAIAAASSAFHTELDKGLGKTKEVESE